MNTLRTKITALLVGAVLLVALLATGLSFLLLSPPRFEETDTAVAAQWALLVDLAGKAGDARVAEKGNGFAGLSDQEPTGEIARMPSEGINAALARRGRAERVSVRASHGGPWPIVTGQLADGRWLTMPMTMPPHPGNGGWALAGWALVMALGTTLVMVVAVRRLTEPLALLERTVAKIGPDGRLEPLPEEGPTEVRAAAHAINRLSSRLKQAMESRIRLVAAAGHDLRTPMTRMRLRAEFFEDEEERATWIADLNELDRIADSAIRLVREEVDDAARSPVRLDGLVREVVGELKSIGMRLELEHAEPASVLARPLSLCRAIRNLAINAATHGRAAVVRVERSGGEALVVIDDAGPGIPEEMMARVFEPFFRVDPARGTPIPGAGLGLAIAHEIVTGIEGRLELKNRPGGGLTQIVHLPLAPDAANADRA
ncbi:ATP-binding protein [Ancylobacter mangrovi]|uniref:ATP-binding protein n=1 Tax=Ancylobacter mangrovi TaxID=2972472 RepID=UPI0021622C5E|nr:ATP-binding protein [Ancylobacter mangrovi]MCS0504806.1 ATP-binding protein [Ancylobacter mangrovi]